MPGSTLSARQARRIALSAQGFAGVAPPGPPGRRRVGSVIERLGVIQLDSVSVLVRSHYLPLFSRLGAYERGALEDAAWGPRRTLFEYWGHEASLLPIASQPLFRWRMARARDGEIWEGLAKFGREQRDFIQTVLGRIAADGPLTGGDFAQGARTAGWWNWSEGKKALEWLFWAGLITTRTRRGFERVYDLTERVLPAAVLDAPTPHEADAHRALLNMAAQAMGVATASDLRDYFRLPAAGVSARLAELAELGEIRGVIVEGWAQPAWLSTRATAQRQIDANALLSPFDNLIWRRERAERLFGARIRLEIYTPAHKRRHGYYVLPFVMGDTIVARVDLKSDRPAGELLVKSAHLEPAADAGEVAERLAPALRRLSDWLALDRVRVDGAGDLAPALAAALAQAPATR